MKWSEDFINRIICGDCLEVMKEMFDNSIDTIITDPPYGIGFMGKEWDNFEGSYIREGLKSTKYNEPVKKGLDKRITKKRGSAAEHAGLYDQSVEAHIKFQEWVRRWAIEALRVAKPGATLLCFGGTRTYHRLACAIEDAGWILKDCIMWIYGSGFPKASDISKQLDKGHKRKVIDKREGTYADIRRDKNTGIAELHGGIATQKEMIKSYITAPATPEATLWNGWKSHGLKPAYEPILVAVKPNEGSYANNALKWGVAGLNVDGGRIEYINKQDKESAIPQGRITQKNSKSGVGAVVGGKNNYEANKEYIKAQMKGRYPANVILDEEAGRLLDEQSGDLKPPWGKESESQNDTSWYSGKTDSYGKLYRDSGGASRFFYCAKASKAERNRGCEGLEAKYNDDSRKDKNAIGCNNPRNRSGTPKKNSHPTVKPLALMKYLCTLTKTPTGGIVLDPFCGSGTTLMACKELKRDYIGIDNQPEYCEIARKRVNATPELLFQEG